MANLFRLITVIFLCAASIAFASVPLLKTWRASGGQFGVVITEYFPSEDAACAAYQAQAAVRFPGNWGAPAYKVEVLSGSPYCSVNRLNNWSSVAMQTGSAVCPAHSVYQAATNACKCDTGYEERDWQCKTPQSVCVDKAGKPAGGAEFGPYPKGSFSGSKLICQDGCQASGTPSYWACNTSTNQCTVGFAKSTYTGSPCSGEGNGEPGAPPPDPKPIPEDKKCPAGKVPGSVSGTDVCVTPGEAGSSTTTGSTSSSTGTTTTNPDGSTTTSGGGSGSSTSTTSTSCNGTNCSTTVTTTISGTDADGKPTTETTTGTMEKPQREFCKDNPKDKACVGDEGQSSFGGDCVSGFKPQGDDAVLNAMAKEQHERNCQVLDTTGPQSLAIKGEMDKTGNRTGDNPNNSSVTIGSGNIDTSDALGGGACALNKTFTVRGMSVTLPFNNLCDPLAMFGNLLVAVAMLLAARIITRG